MNFPYTDVMASSGSIDRPVLLSERTQLIVIKALQQMEFREVWEETTAAEWDTLEEYVASAEEQILKQVASATMWNSVDVHATTDIALSTGETTISWHSGTGYDNTNPTRLSTDAPDGLAILSTYFQVTAGTGRTITVKIRKNGSTVIGHYTDSVSETTKRVTFTIQDSDFVSGDYYELLVTVNSGSSFNSNFSGKQFILSVIS